MKPSDEYYAAVLTALDDAGIAVEDWERHEEGWEFNAKIAPVTHVTGPFAEALALYIGWNDEVDDGPHDPHFAPGWHWTHFDQNDDGAVQPLGVPSFAAPDVVAAAVARLIRDGVTGEEGRRP